MTSVEVVLALIKIIIVIGFLVTAAGIATWADRRQSAMVQDRIGPNRAVIPIPSNVARAVVLLLPALLGVAALFTAAPELREALSRAFRDAQEVKMPTGRLAVESMTLGVQSTILIVWVSLALLAGVARRSGPLNSAEATLATIDPRSIFYGGLFCHAIGFVITGATPLDAAPVGVRIAHGALALTLFAVGIYAASRVPDGSVPFRMAGILHTAADGIKLVWKEDFIPKNADKFLHSLAPFLTMLPPLVALAVVPFGDSICFGEDGQKGFTFGDLGRIMNNVPREWACAGHTVHLQIADLNVGILYIFAITGTGVVGAALAGWASDNKFSLLGGLRAASQMVSYEVAMGMSLVGLFLVYGSVRLRDMVEWQGDNAWGVFVQPFGFLLFLAALAAETKRVPFDQPEGESEIVAGYFVEYSGMKFGMFYLGEYAELITSSAILATLFFGGYHLPFLHRDGLTIAFGDSTLFDYKMTHFSLTIVHALVFFGKTAFVAFVQIFFRWTLPRFRYDQLMKLGWTRLLPMSIANLLVTGVLVLAIDGAPSSVHSALKFAGDVTQGVLAVGMFAGIIAAIVGLLEPAPHKRFIRSTAARFAAAAGGTKSSPQQA